MFRKSIFVIWFGAILMLVACGAREQNQPMPAPSATPTVMIPNVVIETPTPTPTIDPWGTPTPESNPYASINRYWHESRWDEDVRIEEARRKGDTREVDEEELSRGKATDLEERILKGEIVPLESGTVIDLNGDGVREAITYEGEGINVPICIGEAELWAFSECDFTGRVYGTCPGIERDSEQIQLLLEYSWLETVDGEETEVIGTTIVKYEIGPYGDEIYELTAIYPYTAQEWAEFRENRLVATEDGEYMFSYWEYNGREYHQAFEIPEELSMVNCIATTTCELYTYKIEDETIDSRIPAGSQILVIAQNDEWLYVTDCEYEVYAYLKVGNDGGETIVHAPQRVTLEEALAYEEVVSVMSVHHN